MQRWHRFWFSPAGPTNLAVARIVIAIHALWLLLSRDFAAISALPPEFWSGVRASSMWRYLLFPGHYALETGLTALAVACLLAVLVGVATRAACAASAVLLYHLAPLETIIWTPNPYERGLEVTVLALVVLAAAPCGDALSLSSSRNIPREHSGDYRWPLVLIQLFVAQIYLFAGYAKLYRVGWPWVSAENLRRWLLMFNQEDQVAMFTTVGPWLAEHPTLLLGAAVATIAFDLGFILVLFFRWARWVFLPTAVLFHAGIALSMNIAFLNLPQLLLFVDWERLPTIGARLRGAPRSR